MVLKGKEIAGQLIGFLKGNLLTLHGVNRINEFNK